jgi:Trypsin
MEDKMMRFFLFFWAAIVVALTVAPAQAIVTGGTNEDRATFGGVLRFGSLQSFSPSRGCSGVLISSRMALTAAHCFDGFRTTTTVYMQERGSTNTVCITWRSGHCVAEDLNVERHPHYDGGVENDIALVIIANGTFSFRGDPIPKEYFARLYSDRLDHSVWMMMTGFGPVLPSGVGHGEYHESRFKRSWIGDNHFVYDEGPKSRVCKGDSGGPAYLIAKGEDPGATVVPITNPVVVGLLKGREDKGSFWCGDPGVKARWVKISPKVPWIATEAILTGGGHCREAHRTVADVKVWLCFD